MDVLFGGMPDVARFVVAFLLVLVLLGALAFLWRRFGMGALPAVPRGRQPRLAVIDQASVDGRRQLVLIRRDNTEHLLMIGGPTDIVVEPNINRTNAATREPRPIPTADISPRASPSVASSSTASSPLESSSWGQAFEPAARPIRSMEDLEPPRSETTRPETTRPETTRPEPTQRSAREAMAESMRAMRAEPAARATPSLPSRLEPDDEITAPALTPPPMPEPSLHPAMPEPRRSATPPPVPPPPPAYEPVFQAAPEPRRTAPPPPPPPYEPVLTAMPEPRRMPTPPSQEPVVPAMPEPMPIAHEPTFHSGMTAEPRRAAAIAPRSPTDENNLAEMAQRLEAALRRPTKPVEPPPPPPPAPPAAAMPAAAPAPVRPAAAPASRAAAYFETAPAKGPAREPAPAAPAELKIMPGPAKAEPPFESLEDEMAKMLGRSPGKT